MTSSALFSDVESGPPVMVSALFGGTVAGAEKAPPAHRTYRLPSGEKVPSVTTVLGRVIRKQFLETWRGKVGNDAADQISRESSTLGSAIHLVCENIARGNLNWQPDPELLPYHRAFNAWTRANVAEVLAVEQRVYSVEHRYAGTCDGIYVLRDDPRPVMVDLKSSKAGNWQPDSSFALQLVAYQAAAWESLGIRCARRLVLQLPSNRPGEILEHWYSPKMARDDWQAWLAALRLYQWLSDAEAAPGRGLAGG